MASLFTRIINGEIPCHKLAEDDRYFTIMERMAQRQPFQIRAQAISDHLISVDLPARQRVFQ